MLIKRNLKIKQSKPHEYLLISKVNEFQKSSTLEGSWTLQLLISFFFWFQKVREPKLTEDEMIAKLLNMTQGENSELEIIVNSGDTQAIAKLMNSVTSILNKNSDKAGKRKKERSKMLAHLSINGTLAINGSVIFHNGTVLHNNETAVLGNGTIIQKNGTVEHPNGTLHHNGTWLFGNHTGFNITELTEEQQRQLDRETVIYFPV